MSLYEKVSGTAYLCLGNTNAEQVLGEIGWRKPTLFVNAVQVGIGHRIAETLGLNLAVDGELAHCEWYIEWNGRKIGTEGA